MNQLEYNLANTIMGLVKTAMSVNDGISPCQAIGVLFTVQESLRRQYEPTFREGTSQVMRELHGVTG